jgi:hypothetical protein
VISGRRAPLKSSRSDTSSPSSTDRVATFFVSHRQPILWWVTLARVARPSGRPFTSSGETGDRLAPARRPPVLDVDEPTTRRTTRAFEVRTLIRGAVGRQSALGCPGHSRGAAEARNDPGGEDSSVRANHKAKITRQRPAPAIPPTGCPARRRRTCGELRRAPNRTSNGLVDSGPDPFKPECNCDLSHNLVVCDQSSAPDPAHHLVELAIGIASDRSAAGCYRRSWPTIIWRSLHRNLHRWDGLAVGRIMSNAAR